LRLLLDTHTYLWWLTDDPLLPEAARRTVGDRRSVVHVSAASLWEISLKQSLGRIDLDGADLVDEIAANGFVELSITAGHARLAANLPEHLDDPFERLLVAQARSEGLTLVSADHRLADHGVLLL